MRPELKEALKYAAYLLVLIAAMHFGRGPAPIQFVVVAGVLVAIVITWGLVGSSRGRRDERSVLAALAALGGSATLSELEAALFDGATKFTRVQQLRETIVYLRERGDLVESGDRLNVSGRHTTPSNAPW